MPQESRLTLTGVVKSYGAVKAIRHADFEVRPGQVHALVGENGAGKSTLIKIVSGATTPDTGTIAYDGAPVSITSTVDAIALGIATVYQEPQLFGELTVAENVFMGRELVNRRRVDWAAQNERVVGLLEALGLPAKLATATVGTLPVATQQQVSIAKALAGKCGVLILDEPSAILTDAEIDVLFGIIRRLADDGVAIVYISHRLDEVVKIADQVTVMRDGSTIGTFPVQDMTVRRMAELMVGEALSEHSGPRTTTDGELVLELKALSRAGSFHDVSLELRAGEILGLYGLVGSGVAEIAECVHGLAKTSGGEIVVEGRAVAPRSPREAGEAGIALLPANRKTEGMFAFQSIAFNVSIGHLRLLSLGRAFVDRRRERSVVKDLMKRLAVRAQDENQPIGNLSGGNAQKVMLARQLVERPKLLLLAEPTQGVDIGAKEEIHRIITDLADNGTAVLVVTSDLQEALRITDRLLVVRTGTIAAEFGPDARQVDVLAAAAGDREGTATG
ncbi:ribose import ATP-binding protein RbsA 1 [Mycobacterium antarcticum]|uniref:sugar ABC transporter ATP-binding protein n=1 Tax=unclassified Mycolicibacterium TaxID=2636767 RepID=UPI0023A2A379|nr:MULTISPECIES: sugar ABC transporter ATP-binding protein [unclassified Mycolicibacterium]BDX31477.1 ribose import ATP-binding protein RbsA 1 [Mycolicibacterium sp. TUM20985]GLP74824.1 ribose import ATP-binding protein RbsA 1 [Mycolicibacterium sp. TUM20983]GLP80624.1 ribose import ATP-binding protein RbsA 1 [Mycolicibacterium sp. TUM20984]